MNQLSNWLQETLGLPPDIQVKLLESLITLIVLWLIYRLILRYFIERIEDVRLGYQWRKNVGYILSILGVLLVGRIWLEEGLESLFTFFGLLSAGLAIAMRDPIVNFFGWIFILWRNPFAVGDRIQIGDDAGDVVDQRVFQFSIVEIGNWVDADQSTGRIIHIPNGKVFVESLANFSRGIEYLWNEIPVLITFESDWAKAKEILGKISDKHAIKVSDSDKLKDHIEEYSKGYLIHYANLKPIVYTSVKDSGVLLTIRYLCGPRDRRGSSHIIWENILEEFAKHSDIDFAYPTRRIFSKLTESRYTPSID